MRIAARARRSPNTPCGVLRQGSSSIGKGEKRVPSRPWTHPGGQPHRAKLFLCNGRCWSCSLPTARLSWPAASAETRNLAPHLSPWAKPKQEAEWQEQLGRPGIYSGTHRFSQPNYGHRTPHFRLCPVKGRKEPNRVNLSNLLGQ